MNTCNMIVVHSKLANLKQEVKYNMQDMEQDLCTQAGLVPN